MTIIEPAKNKYYLNEFFYLLTFILLSAIFSIHIYNLNVNLNYQISLSEKEIQKLESSNADLQNQLYKILDIHSLSSLIKEENLISDKNPDYFEYNALAGSY